jgi:hypothetical protein
MAHAIGCVEPDWTTISGQGANSQFGPVLPTALPSGQTLASSVHAWGNVVFVFVHPANTILNNSNGMINFFIEKIKK